MSLSELIAKLQELQEQHGDTDNAVVFEFGIEVDFHWDGDFLHIGSPEAIADLKQS